MTFTSKARFHTAFASIFTFISSLSLMCAEISIPNPDALGLDIVDCKAILIGTNSVVHPDNIEIELSNGKITEIRAIYSQNVTFKTIEKMISAIMPEAGKEFSEKLIVWRDNKKKLSITLSESRKKLSITLRSLDKAILDPPAK